MFERENATHKTNCFTTWLTLAIFFYKYKVKLNL